MILVHFAIFISLLAISAIDIKHRRISSKALIVLLLCGVASIMFNKGLNMINGIAAMLIVFIVLWILKLCTKGSIGMGDAKLCAVLALYLGIEKALNMLALSIILCGATAAILIIIRKTDRNKSLPFAPFVTAGTLAMLIIQ